MKSRVDGQTQEKKDVMTYKGNRGKIRRKRKFNKLIHIVYRVYTADLSSSYTWKYDDERFLN